MPADPKRVKEIFLAVSEATDGRTAILDRECAGDAELRARVEALLHAQEAPAGFLRRRPESTAAHRPPHGLQLGETFAGRFKLREELGHGGMGVVFVADQTEPVQRRVALKVIRAGADSARMLARFEQERQALAVMDHPNIAKFFDAGICETGQPYFVMELIKGMPFTDYCDKAKLTPRERLELFVPVCHAVQHAHQKGVIHRDLKPSNILVGLYDGKPVPKVIDFGVAKATGQRLSEASVYTEVGSIIGTLEYMSPEQAELNNLDIDTRSDVYALGVILYQLLTGTVPFSREELQAGGFAEMLRIIKEKEPPRPSNRLSTSHELSSMADLRRTEPARLSKFMRGELDWIVMKALEKDRNRRYETANGLARDVQRFLMGEAVEACPPTLGYRLRKLYRRNKAAILTAGSIAAVLLLATGVSLAFGILAKRAQQRADASAGEAIKSEGVAQDRLQQLSEALRNLNAEQARRSGLEYARTIQFADTALHASKFDVARKTLDAVSPERRGWEWHYLNRLWRSDYLLEFRPHRGIVQSAFYSPDGKQIVTASATSDGLKWTGTVEVWNADTGQLLYMLADDVPELLFAAFSPDGTKLLTVQDSAIRIWNLDSRKAEWEVHPDAGMIFASAALAPDGKRILIRSRAARDSKPRYTDTWSVAVWDVQSKKPLWPAHRWENERVSSPSFSADGKWVIASVSTRNQQPDKEQTRAWWLHTDVIIWDATTGKVAGQLRTPTPAGTRLATVTFSPKADRIITCDFEGRALIWPVKTMGEQLVRAGDPVVLPSNVSQAIFSPDGTQVAVMGASWRDQASVQIRDVATGSEVRTLRGHSGSLWSVAYSPDGTRIVTAGNDGTVKTWDANASDASRIRTQLNHNYVSFSPKGDQLLTCNYSVTKVWDSRTGKELSPPLQGGLRGYHQHSDFSPDGRWIATIEGSTIRIYDAKTYKLRHTLQERNGDVYLISFSPDGTQLLVANDHSTVTIWDVEKETELDRISTASRVRGYSHTAFSPSGELFLVEHLGTEAQTMSGITLYDARTRKPQSKLNTGTIHYYTWHGVFSGDGKRFVGYFMFKDRPNECRVWNVATGELEFTFQTHSGSNAQFALSPDGKRLLTIGDNLSIKMWDMASGIELLTIPTEYHVNSVAFHPDGTKFAINHNWEEARIYDGTPLAPGTR